MCGTAVVVHCDHICPFEGDILGKRTLGGVEGGAMSCDGRSGPLSPC